MILRKLAQLALVKEGHKLQGETEVQGIEVAIENRKGSVREGTTEDGHHWRTKMKAPYGYLKGTKGADGEEIDAYVGPDKEAPKAYVVHQHKPDGTGFDEDKVILGVRSKEEAKKLYLQHYDDPKFLGPISTVPVEKLKEKIEKGGVLRKIADAVLPEAHSFREARGNCGPASLRIALRQHGLDVPERTLAEATKTTEEGTTPEDIACVSGAKVVDKMPLGQLKKLTDSGTPVIVAYQGGPASSDQNGHYSVVSKVDEHVHLSDPSSRKPIREIPTDQFAARWHDVDKEGKERPQLGIVMRKLAAQVLSREGEFAPGIPGSRETHPIPRVFHDKPETWHMAVQHHDAAIAGPHIDLRLVDKRGLGHSWAIPKASLPKPGEKALAVQQPTHTLEYSARRGTFELPEGYGKGTVRSSGLTPVEVVRSQPGMLRFNVYGGPKEGNQEYALVQTSKGHLLHNITATAESGVRGAGGHPIPSAKPAYREVSTDKVRFDDAEEIHQAKVDGAHVTFHLRDGKGVKVFSYRPTERATGVLEHTHKLPDYRNLIAPPGLAGTVLRGELYGADKHTGAALPAEQTGGLLNATVWRSRERQQELGAELRPVIFDVVRYKGRDVSNAPYSEKLQILHEVQAKIPRLKLPPTATTPKEKEELFRRIQTGQEPITREGIVSWKLPYPYPTKAKFRPDVDAEIVGVTPGKGKHEGRIGALQVKLPGKDAVTNVGTGLSDEMRAQIAKDPGAYIGQVAKVRTQQVFTSGRLRAPSFAGFHIEKGKQLMEKQAADVAWLEKLADRVKPKGIKIFYINTGGGHKSQAEALAEAAKKRGIPTETIYWGQFAKGDHLKEYEKVQQDYVNGKASLLAMGKAQAKFSLFGTDKDKLRDWVSKNKDQAVVLTMAYLERPFNGIKHPVHVLHSDPVPWPFAPTEMDWQKDRIHIGVPNVLESMGATRNIPVTGLPVKAEVLNPTKKSGLLSKKDFNVTVSGGSLGMEVLPLTKQVLRADLPENAVIHAVTGKNADAFRHLSSLAKKDSRLRVHGYAPLPTMMHEADLNVVRTHGTTFAETVASGKPAVYYGPDPKLTDFQGDMTKRTALYAGKNVGHPIAIGLDKVTGAVNTALQHHDHYMDLAGKARRKMGDPAPTLIGRIMKARPEYERVKTATIAPEQLRRGTPRATSFEAFREKLRPGDVILTKPSDNATLGTQDRALRGTVKFYDWLSGAKHRGWAHTALYLGDDQIAHLYEKKLRRGKIVPMGEGINRVVQDKIDVFKQQGYDLAAIRPRVGADEAVQRMKDFAATPVDISPWKFARNLIRTGLTPFGGKTQRDAVCSGIVGAAFPKPLADRKPFSMRPKDFLESKKTVHVVGFSPDGVDKMATIRELAQRVLGGKDGTDS